MLFYDDTFFNRKRAGFSIINITCLGKLCPFQKNGNAKLNVSSNPEMEMLIHC